jgi:hypothetical protein
VAYRGCLSIDAVVQLGTESAGPFPLDPDLQIAYALREVFRFGHS